jgi:hypothetical protein
LEYFTYFASFPIYLKALAIENAQKGNDKKSLGLGAQDE